MLLHKIKFLNNPSTLDDPNPPPIALPVMYQNDRIALAVFEDAYYRFNLSQPISELLESETFVLGFAYTDQFNQIHGNYTPGAVLTSIQLLFADDEDSKESLRNRRNSQFIPPLFLHKVFCVVRQHTVNQFVFLDNVINVWRRKETYAVKK